MNEETMTESTIETTEQEEEKIVMGQRATEVVVCNSCGKELTVEERNAFAGSDGNDIYFCDDCLVKINAELEAETKNPNYLGAIALGFLTCIVLACIQGGIIALTKTDFGIVEILMGFAIAYMVGLGAGKKRGLKLQIIATFLAYLSFNYSIVASLAFTGELSTFVDVIMLALVSPFVVVFHQGPIGLVIWAIGLYTAFINLKPRKL